jgi:hypothetical protein
MNKNPQDFHVSIVRRQPNAGPMDLAKKITKISRQWANGEGQQVVLAHRIKWDVSSARRSD